jgi:hypothetical protein
VLGATASSGSSNPESSLRTLFTRVDAGCATISPAGYGSRSESACSFVIVGSSQVASASVGRITGIRSCTGATNAFGCVVMIVQLSRISSVASPVREVQRPANANCS